MHRGYPAGPLALRGVDCVAQCFDPCLFAHPGADRTQPRALSGCVAELARGYKSSMQQTTGARNKTACLSAVLGAACPSLQELRIDRLSLDGDGALLIKGCTYLVRCGRVRARPALRNLALPTALTLSTTAMMRCFMVACAVPVLRFRCPRGTAAACRQRARSVASTSWRGA